MGASGGCIRRVQTAWPHLGLAVNSPWLELGGLCFNRKWAKKAALSPCIASNSSFQDPFYSARVIDHCPSILRVQSLSSTGTSPVHRYM